MSDALRGQLSWRITLWRRRADGQTDPVPLSSKGDGGMDPSTALQEKVWSLSLGWTPSLL